MPRKTISILGAGWLGEPLAYRLVQEGYAVKGSTTSAEKVERLRAGGVEPYVFRLDDEAELPGGFFDCDVLFLNIPPGRRNPDVQRAFLPQVRRVQEALHRSGTRSLIFASSTSVYPDLNRVVTEEDARHYEKPVANALLSAESMLALDPALDATILRFAGLYGYERKPGRFLAGRRGVDNPEAPVNLIHRDDCVNIVADVIGRGLRGEVLNACSDEHPTRRAFYTWAAARLGLEPPEFEAGGETTFKVVSSGKLKERLGYVFLYPDPMQEAP